MYEYLGEKECYKIIGAIFKQAKKDYKYYLKKLYNNPTNKEAKKEIKKLKSFFKSSWVYDFVEVDGNAIVKKIENDFFEEMREKAKKLKSPKDLYKICKCVLPDREFFTNDLTIL